jgi:anaerobic selenocysteine-containing dehydrogenase
MSQTTACPLDCYDACRISVDENGKMSGDKSHFVTRGYLCPHLNHFDKHPRIVTPRFRDREVSMEEAITILTDRLTHANPNKVLYYRGSGNIGVLQRSMDHFFSQMGATGTRGSLCDSAGEAGVLEGRGVNYPLSPQMIDESEVVIVWGRNVHVTHSHLLPFLKHKTIIVIDPVQTKLAQTADLYVQIKPHCDLQLALLLSRFAVIEGLHDQEFLDTHASAYEAFYELTQTLRIKVTLESIDMTLGQIGSILNLIRGKKTIILVGVGVQKYRNGADVLRAIDGFAALMGWFGKRGCGVSFLGSSKEALTLPFVSIHKTVPIATIDFSNFETLFVQGGNPLAQMPNSLKVREEFSQVDFKVYFGLYENETSLSCDLIIPAKTFLEKNDVRASYGDFTLQMMNKVRDSDIGIGEYALSAFLCDHFSLSIPSEAECLEMLHDQMEEIDGVSMKKNRPHIPYGDGFLTDSGEFEFLEELDFDSHNEEGLFLITCKSSRSLNSQFYREDGIFLHPKCGFCENERVRVSNKVGEILLVVHYDSRLRHDCALIYSGTPEVNILTPSVLSYEGENAVYQELKIKVEKYDNQF